MAGGNPPFGKLADLNAFSTFFWLIGAGAVGCSAVRADGAGRHQV
jgi:hypothetical protein